MSQTTREEVLTKLRRRYQTAGAQHKRKLLDQAQELLGYHRKSAIRALRALTVERGPRIMTGRPTTYEPSVLLPWLRPIWAAPYGIPIAPRLPQAAWRCARKTPSAADTLRKNDWPHRETLLESDPALVP